MTFARNVLVVSPDDGLGQTISSRIAYATCSTGMAESVAELSSDDCLVYAPSPAWRQAEEWTITDRESLCRILYTPDPSAPPTKHDFDVVVDSSQSGSLNDLVSVLDEQFHPVLTDGGVDQSSSESTFPLERLHEIAADGTLTREEKIDKLLAAGAKRLGTSAGFLGRIEGNVQEVVRSVGGHPELEPGATAPLSETYCQYTIERDRPLAVTAVEASNVIGEQPYERFGLECYLGTSIHVQGEPFGTVCFVDTEPRDSEFGPREETFVQVLTDWISYLLEQRVYEQELDEQRAFTESLMNSLPDPLFATDETGAIVRWNTAFEAILGNTSVDDVGEHTLFEGTNASEIVSEDQRDSFADAIAAALDGEQRSVEVSVPTGEDARNPYEISIAPLHDEAGAITGVAGVGRDVSDRRKHRERLSGILDTTQSLMQARDRDQVAEIAVVAAKELLGFDISVFRLYDSEAGTLVPAAQTEESLELIGERPVYDVGEGNPGEVFATGESLVIDDLWEESTDADFGPVRSVMYYPVGVHGTLSVASTSPGSFDETDKQMLALLATSAAAACMRAKREQDVREAQEHTERVLERINGLVQNTVEVLVQATTRDELEAGVVEQLAAADPYTFAWIGKPDVASETLSPTAAAGETEISIHGRSFDLTRTDEPISLAYNEREPQVIPDITDPASGLWSVIAEGSAVESLIAIPLVYKDTNYGVLSVFADDRDALDERERIVLESLGRVIANAINAIERGRILDATEIIQLEFSVTDQGLLFGRLSSAADCAIESAGMDVNADGTVRLYLTASDVDGETLLEVASDDVGVDEATLIVDHEDECLLELIVEDSLLRTLTEYGAVPRNMTAENGQTRFTVELPYEAEARDLFELVEEQYPSTELLGYHERERPVQTRQEFKAALSDRFTDRQETALRTAYLGGFFDWPREIDGNELADAMDISRPTYHQHLRAAQQKVFEELFD